MFQGSEGNCNVMTRVLQLGSLPSIWGGLPVYIYTNVHWEQLSAHAILLAVHGPETVSKRQFGSRNHFYGSNTA